VAETRTVDRSSERQHIIDAAYRCLDRNAGSAVSITEILDEAGLGTRAFYRNFSTKHDLLLELFRRDRDAVRAQLREVVARAEGPVEALRAWMAHMLDHFGPSLLSPWTRLDAPELTPELRDSVVAGTEAAAAGRSIAELVRERDRRLVDVLRVLGKVGDGS